MENNKSDTDSLDISLPYIDHETCRKMYTNGFETFVTADKFCAGSTLGNKIFIHIAPSVT